MLVFIMIEVLSMFLGTIVWFFKTNPNLGNTLIKEIFDYKKIKLFLEHKGKAYEKGNENIEEERKKCKKKKR